MLYAALINHYPKTFRNIYNLPRILALRSREEDLRIRLISEPHTFFLVQHCLVVAFLFIVLVPDVDQWVPSGWFTSPGVGSYLWLWLLLSLVVLLTVWVKYLIVVLFGSLFKLKQFTYLHMFDFMRLSMMFWGTVFLLAICAHYNFTLQEQIYERAANVPVCDIRTRPDIDPLPAPFQKQRAQKFIFIFLHLHRRNNTPVSRTGVINWLIVLYKRILFFSFVLRVRY